MILQHHHLGDILVSFCWRNRNRRMGKRKAGKGTSGCEIVK